MSLSLETLQSQGRVVHTEKSVWSALRLRKHFSGLFATRLLGYSTLMIIANWFVIGMVTPLYSVFLPYYLKSRGADVGSDSNEVVWRNYAINQLVGIAGPAIAGILVETQFIGRRGTLAIGAALTMVSCRPARFWRQVLTHCRYSSSPTRKSRRRHKILEYLQLLALLRTSTTAPSTPIHRRYYLLRIELRATVYVW